MLKTHMFQIMCVIEKRNILVSLPLNQTTYIGTKIKLYIKVKVIPAVFIDVPSKNEEKNPTKAIRTNDNARVCEKNPEKYVESANVNSPTTAPTKGPYTYPETTVVSIINSMPSCTLKNRWYILETPPSNIKKEIIKTCFTSPAIIFNNSNNSANTINDTIACILF